MTCANNLFAYLWSYSLLYFWLNDGDNKSYKPNAAAISVAVDVDFCDTNNGDDDDDGTRFANGSTIKIEAAHRMRNNILGADKTNLLW